MTQQQKSNLYDTPCGHSKMAYKSSWSYPACAVCKIEHQQELDDARAEMIFREEQLFVLDSGRINPDARWHMEQQHEAARDRYLALLAEKRIRDLREVTA